MIAGTCDCRLHLESRHCSARLTLQGYHWHAAAPSILPCTCLYHWHISKVGYLYVRRIRTDHDSAYSKWVLRKFLRILRIVCIFFCVIVFCVFFCVFCIFFVLGILRTRGGLLYSAFLIAYSLRILRILCESGLQIRCRRTALQRVLERFFQLENTQMINVSEQR
jgi:hypothetical protein